MLFARFVFGLSLLALSASAGTYTTTFPTSESPLSQGGMWVNGSLAGFMKGCAVTNVGGLHYAFGLQPGTNVPPVYDDSVAVLTGTWGPTQALDFTVYFTNQQPSSAGYWEEIEYGLNCVLSNRWFSGYFMDLGLNSDSGYIELGISYNGTNNVGLGGNVYGAQYVVTNGSTLHVGLTNKTISVFLNGNLAVRVTDTTGISIPNGAPCIGFYHQGDNGSRRTDFGISRFTATDFRTGNVDQPPNISDISNQVIAVNTTAGPIPFTVSDAETPATNLVVSANSDNAALVPAANIVLSGSASNRNVTVTPATGATGVANITLSVSDGVAVTSTSFQLTVQSRPQPPNNVHVVGG